MFFLSSYLRSHHKMLIGVLSLATVNQVFSLLDPQVFRWIVDNYIMKFKEIDATTFLHGIFIGMGLLVGVAMVSRVAKNFQDYFVNVITQKIGLEIYQRTINHAFNLPYSVFEDQQSGQLIQKLNKAKTDIQTYINSLINILFVAVIGILFVVIYALWVHRIIGAIFISIFPLMGSVSYLLSKRIKKAQDMIVKESADLAGSTTETIRNISLVKILGLESQEMKRLEDANNHILTLELKKIKTIRSLEFLQGTMINAIRVSLLGTMFTMIFYQMITLGEFLSLFFYSFYVFAPLGQMGVLIKNYQEAKASHDVLDEIMQMKPVPKNPDAVNINEINDLAFNKVSFGYNGTPDTLKNISFEIKSGQTIGFVGPSGSGKTTILKLLCGLYDTTEGEITLNQTPLQSININAFKKRIGMVTQDTQLFAGTIKKNLQFVKPHATDEECIKVLEQAQLGDLLKNSSHGLHTKIGEGGLKLSGGQKQRLSIARALLRDPDILIFDEATSALDSIVEKEISETIHHIGQSRKDLMMIIVAHRLSTLMRSDRIYVLEKGHMIEQGNHQELVDQKGLYYALRREQSGSILRQAQDDR